MQQHWRCTDTNTKSAPSLSRGTVEVAKRTRALLFIPQAAPSSYIPQMTAHRLDPHAPTLDKCCRASELKQPTKSLFHLKILHQPTALFTLLYSCLSGPKYRISDFRRR